MTELSGKQWCNRFPTSRDLHDLVSPFRENAGAFINALLAGGSRVHISATRRPSERAYLMHAAWAIARLGVDPASIPPQDGIDIEWVHENAGDAAEAMVEGFGMVHQAVLDSLHIPGRAIDLDIEVPNGAVIRDGQGVVHTFHGAATGMDPRLHAIGATFKVFKLVSDRPHWSDNGH